MLNRNWIAAHIPHQGAMCLLDSVVDWSPERIHCRSSSHTATDNPLRADGCLGAANGIEYAAQAMAVHGALLADPTTTPRQGYLTSVRSVALHVDRLDDLDGPLDVRAERLSGDSTLILYQFSVEHGGQPLLAGRATVILDAAAHTPPEGRQ